MTIEQYYILALGDLLSHGSKKELQAGQGAASYILSDFGRTFRARFSDGFPIYHSKFVWWKGAIAEMLWFLSGESYIENLRADGCHIWDDWAFKQYVQNVSAMQLQPMSETEFWAAFDEGDIDLGPLPLHYTNCTNWAGTGLDQTEWVLSAIAKKPHRKSYLVSAWDPTQVYEMAEACGKQEAILPACHYAHQLDVIGDGTEANPYKVSLLVNIRSNDAALGNPFNLVQYAALLQMYVHCLLNRTSDFWEPNELVVQVGNWHLYSNHIEAIKQQIAKFESSAYLKCLEQKPELHIEQRGQRSLQDFLLSDFKLTGYKHLGQNKMDVYVAGGR